MPPKATSKASSSKTSAAGGKRTAASAKGSSTASTASTAAANPADYDLSGDALADAIKPIADKVSTAPSLLPLLSSLFSPPSPFLPPSSIHPLRLPLTLAGDWCAVWRPPGWAGADGRQLGLARHVEQGEAGRQGGQDEPHGAAVATPAGFLGALPGLQCGGLHCRHHHGVCHPQRCRLHHGCGFAGCWGPW